MENSKIEWTHHTANLWHGCVEVHAGCDNCYAKKQDNRYHKEQPHWGKDSSRLHIKKTFFDLVKFQRVAAERGVTERVFVGSMMDIFEKPIPLVDGNNNPAIDSSDGSPITTSFLRERLFDNISQGLYPNLQFLLLTKRPSNINKYIPEAWKRFGAPKNVMFGYSVVDNKSLQNVYDLMKVKGRKFLSCEPLLEKIDIAQGVLSPNDKVPIPVLSICEDHYPVDGFIGDCIEWIICGGESGHKARPMNPEWARDLKRQCYINGTSFFMKQGSQDWPDFKNIESFPKDLQLRQFPL